MCSGSWSQKGGGELKRMTSVELERSSKSFRNNLKDECNFLL